MKSLDPHTFKLGDVVVISSTPDDTRPLSHTFYRVDGITPKQIDLAVLIDLDWRAETGNWVEGPDDQYWTHNNRYHIPTVWPTIDQYEMLIRIGAYTHKKLAAAVRDGKARDFGNLELAA